MKLWRRRRSAPLTSPAARAAREKAERDLAATRAQTPQILELARILRTWREANDLAAQLNASFRGGR